MKLSRRLTVLIQFAAVVGIAFNPQFAFAYEHPLSGVAIRDAYFVGQDEVNVNKFLSQYLRGLPKPEEGPDVTEIELSTPYAQVVEASAQHSVGYSAMQASEDYRKRGDYIAVRVKVLLTPTYTTTADDFWRKVSVELVENTGRLVATSIDGQPIYASDPDGTGHWLIGADIYLNTAVRLKFDRSP